VIPTASPHSRKAEATNATTTLVWMALLPDRNVPRHEVLGYLYGVHPHASETGISQFARIMFTGPVA
jgi:hypothetical protein